MPNIKISSLPAGTSPLSGTELVPVVQNGTTVQVLASAIGQTATPGYTAENVANKTNNLNVDGTSTVKYPTASAVTSYVNNAVAGLLDDRGNYTPGVLSPGAFPTAANNGSGPGGVPYKGDIWFITASGFIGTAPVVAGMSVRALVNTPGQTASNWDLLDTVAGLSPEQTTNKLTTGASVAANQANPIKYPSAKALVEYLTQNPPTLQNIVNGPYSNIALSNGRNYQGTSAGQGNTGTEVNLFGGLSGQSNSGNNVNAMGYQAAYINTGGDVNAFGIEAVSQNTGSFINGIGPQAALLNSGKDVNAMGYQAAASNTVDNVNAIGRNSGQGNSGINLNGLGEKAGKGNTGADVNTMGYQSGFNQTGSNVNTFGRNAGNLNTGDNVNGFGQQAAKGNTNDHVNALGINAGLNNTFRNVNLFGPSASADGNGQLVWVTEPQFNMRLDANDISANRKLTMPDADGTAVISVNGVTPDPAGNVSLTIPTPTPALPYLMYAAFISFSQIGISSVQQIYNTIGDGSGDGINDIAWSVGFASLNANMSAGPFVNGKTAPMSSIFPYYTNVMNLIGSRQSSSLVSYDVYNTFTGGTSSIFSGSSVYVEIRIYP